MLLNKIMPTTSRMLQNGRVMQKRYSVFDVSGTPSQRAINDLRVSMPEDLSWLADAMWKDGRRATLREVMLADPMRQELDLDRKIRKRSHPLHHGIKAAFERRKQFIAQREEKSEEDVLRLDIPPDLTDVQRRVFIRMVEEEEKRRRKYGLPKTKTYVSAPQDDFLFAKKEVSSSDLRRFNRLGETDSVDWNDVSKSALFYGLMIYFLAILSGNIGPLISSLG
ncbi:hypothetical protein DIPPA_25867 [Diplonema papillatum]|nr:hypothetical protein DIPPA_25867 [Diplonema papillatum]